MNILVSRLTVGIFHAKDAYDVAYLVGCQKPFVRNYRLHLQGKKNGGEKTAKPSNHT